MPAGSRGHPQDGSEDEHMDRKMTSSGASVRTAEATINSSALREMSPQASFSTAKISQKKWLMTLWPQKGSLQVRMEWRRELAKPAPQLSAAIEKLVCQLMSCE